MTVTVTFAVLAQPVVGAVPVTVYVVVAVGLAETVAPEVEDSPVAGDHENVLEAMDELPVSETELPLQMDADNGATDTVGLGFIVTTN